MGRVFFFLLAFILAASPAAAAADKLGVYGKWQAFSYKEEKNTVCYLLGRPEKTAYLPGKKKSKTARENARANMYAMVTLRPVESFAPVVSLFAGYVFQPSSEVLARIDDKEFHFFTDKDKAWARNTNADTAFVKALQAGKTLKVDGQDEKGGQSRDIYGLKGFADAYKAIAKACGMPF
jgi:hypothetical protein